MPLRPSSNGVTLSSSKVVLRRLSALFFAAGPVAIVNCGCPSTDYRYDRTLRLDPTSTDAAVQEALAAPPGTDLSQSNSLVCDELCVTSQSGSGSETLLGCERGELDGDPALICHLSGHDDCGGVGRTPPGFRPNRDSAAAPDVRGAFLARAAELEAASVHAFLLLADELALHGAPASLVAAAKLAAVEELGHARAMSRLARRYAVQPSPPVVHWPALEPRSLLDMAIDNAVEGCVRETLGALIAGHQARHAEDPEVRHALSHVALEELGHAQLSWRIAEWFDHVANESERQRVRAARDSAFGELGEARGRDPHPLLRRDLGVPRTGERSELVRGLRESVFA